MTKHLTGLSLIVANCAALTANTTYVWNHLCGG
jgi:hypothetical protein